ncbi:MAG: carboxypeptidase-like regulatory domain-containing protein [Acidimicrobiales bacterium]
MTGRLTRLVDRPVLNGTVTSAGSGAPLAGIEVQAFQNGVAVAMTTTAADGAHAFGNLVPGTYTVRFSDPGGTWKLRWWTDGASAAQATRSCWRPSSRSRCRWRWRPSPE